MMGQTHTRSHKMADKNANTPKTPAVVTPKTEAKKAKKLAKKQLRLAAKGRVMEFLGLNDLGTVAEDIKMLIGKGGAIRATSSINSALRSVILQSGTNGVNELVLYKQFKIGRPEMAGKIRKFIKSGNPADRIWVHFDEVKETYFVVGKGPTPPKGWTGYLPAEKSDL